MKSSQVANPAGGGSRTGSTLTPHEFESPTGKRVYDLRHTRLAK
ncbi:hypothetical protein [Streptomyces sp. NPDC127084]